MAIDARYCLRRSEPYPKVLSTVFALLLAMTASPVFAFSGPQNAGNPPLGNCSTLAFNNSGAQRALVNVNESGTNYFAGGAVWNTGGVLVPVPPTLTQSEIETCLNALTGAVTNFQVVGPDAASYAAEDIIGFSFDYEGQSWLLSLTGVTATQLNSNLPGITFVTPSSNAGPDQPSVASGAAVTLSGSDPDGNAGVTYEWTRAGGTGPVVALDDNTSAAPGFTAPTLAAGGAGVDIIFQLVVISASGVRSAPDTVSIQVAAPPDITAPGAPTISNTTTNSDLTVTVNGTAEAGSTVRVIFPHASTVTATAAPGGSYEITSSTAQNAGTIAVDATDSAGNTSAQTTVAYVPSPAPAISVEQTAEILTRFQQTRAERLLSQQPALARLAFENTGGQINATVTRGNSMLSVGATNQSTWLTLSGSRVTSGDTEASYLFASVGHHISVSSNILLGGMLQFDQLNQKDGAERMDGSGFLIGPYVIGQIADTNLRYDARVLYGSTKNKISPLGTFADDVSSKRFLAAVRLEGDFQAGMTTLFPYIDLSYLGDDLEGYTDGLGQSIPGQKVELTRLRFGLDFHLPVETTTGALSLTGGAAISNADLRGSGLAANNLSGYAGGTGQIHLGLTYKTDLGGVLSASFSHSGLGASHYNAQSLTLLYRFYF